jgi:hypothetical protein
MHSFAGFPIVFGCPFETAAAGQSVFQSSSAITHSSPLIRQANLAKPGLPMFASHRWRMSARNNALSEGLLPPPKLSKETLYEPEIIRDNALADAREPDDSLAPSCYFPQMRKAATLAKLDAILLSILRG